MREWTGHVTEDHIKAWISRTMTTEEEQLFLAHTGSCNHCAGLLADYLEQDLMNPPAYLAEEILEKSRSIEIRTARTIRQTSRQLRLFLYSLKVGFALAASLLMLFRFPGAEYPDIRQKMDFPERMQESITGRLKEGSEKMHVFMEELSGRTGFPEYEEEQND